MTHDEAVEELKEIREYFPRSFKGHKALDYAIAQLELIGDNRSADNKPLAIPADDGIL